MPVRTASLELALARLSVRGRDRDAIRLRAVLPALDEFALDHLSPYAFAELAGLPPEEAIALLLRATDAGILALRYNTLCVFCGAIERRFGDEASAPVESFRCEICESDIGVRGGERIEAAFHLAPAIGSVSIDPFANIASYRRRFVSSAIVPSAEFAAYLARALRAQAIVPAGASRTFELSLAPGAVLRAVSYDRHGAIRVRAAAAPSRRDTLTLRSTERGWGTDAVHASAGSLELAVHNAGRAPTGVLVLDGDTDAYHHVIGAHPPTRRPFLSARELSARRARAA